MLLAYGNTGGAVIRPGAASKLPHWCQTGFTWPRYTSAANPKFAQYLPRARVRTSGSKRHWNHSVVVSFDSEVRIGACCKIGRTSESGHDRARPKNPNKTARGRNDGYRDDPLPGDRTRYLDRYQG